MISSRWTMGLGMVVMVFGLSATAWAQPGDGPGGRGFGAMMASPMMILRNEQIQQELEIVEDQLADLQAIGDEMRNAFQGMRELTQEEREERFRTINEEFEAKLNEVLLPHQQKRLKQITTQFSSRGREGLAGSLTSGNLADELNISEDQKQKLREIAEEARAEMDEKVRKARAEAEEKILSVLTEEQRRQYKEMIGEPFELDMRQMFQGRGGPGGDRGGRNRGQRPQNDF